MLFLREILLLAMVLCVCWETGDTTCQIECDQSQIGLALPTCFLRDDGTSTFCGIFISSSDTAIRTLGSFDELTLILDLSTGIHSLFIVSRTSNNIKFSTFTYYTGITKLMLQRSLQVNPVMFFLIPNLKHISMIFVDFDYFPYFGHANRMLSYLEVRLFDIPSTAPHLLARGHISGLSKLEKLWLHPNQYLNTTDQVFAGLTAVTHAYLVNLRIPSPVITLSPLVRLRSLSIIRFGFTDISFLTRTTFLYNLTYLGLSFNRITRIEPGIFSSYAKLVILNLYGNRLGQLECGAFLGLNNLRYLNLGSNPIQNICFTAFKNVKFLTWLSLESASLTSLSSRMFEYLPSLTFIRFSGIPLHCGCCLQWMSIVHQNLGLTLSSGICASPSEHRNKQATDLAIYTNCTADVSYQCFNRSNSCPSGSCCQDTLDAYTCVCEQEGYMFVGSLNRCVSTQEIGNCLS